METSNVRKTAAKPLTTGHDSVIKAIKDQGRHLTVEKMSSGEKVTGLIVGRDKYTVTLLATVEGKAAPVRRVIFKHDISEFYSIEGN